MFTIKHVDASGDEFFIQAKRFLRQRRGDGFMQYLAYHDDPAAYDTTFCGDETPGTLHTQALYVMNEQGRTVQSYHFNEPVFSEPPYAQSAMHSGGDTCVDACANPS